MECVSIEAYGNGHLQRYLSSEAVLSADAEMKISNSYDAYHERLLSCRGCAMRTYSLPDKKGKSTAVLVGFVTFAVLVE